MTDFHSRYPDFDVMAAKEHWDDHTRDIVERRLHAASLTHLSPMEADTLIQLCSHLLGDERPDILKYVVSHFDTLLGSDIGEAQRPMGLPKQNVLLREGLVDLDHLCGSLHGSTFALLNNENQTDVVRRLMDGHVIQVGSDGTKPTEAFMEKVLSEASAAYYSHPTVWSEIGYAGPAYPRGYVRSELGLTDPWEAKRSDAKQG